MSFCHHCGKEVQSDALFCSACGTRQHVEFHKPTSPPPASVPPTSAPPSPDIPPPLSDIPLTAPLAPTPTSRSRAPFAPGEPVAVETAASQIGEASRWPLAAIGMSAAVLVLLVISLIVRIVSNNTPGPEGLPAGLTTRPNAASLNAAVIAGANDIPLDNESSICQSNLKQIALSLQQYAQDNDRRYPPAKSAVAGEVGWADIIQPYLKSALPLRCPLMPTGLSNSPSDPGYTDYYYNSSFENRMMSNLSFPANTIMLGDGAPADARYARTDTESAGLPPANIRHQSGANYAFADGHVKWLSPTMALPATVPVGKSVFSHNAG